MGMFANAFIFAVLTCYTVYRYFIYQNEFLQEMMIIQVNWHIFYSFHAVMIICMGSRMSHEVII